MMDKEVTFSTHLAASVLLEFARQSGMIDKMPDLISHMSFDDSEVTVHYGDNKSPETNDG